MSQEHRSEHPDARTHDAVPDALPEDGRQALSALRGVWRAQDQTSAELDEACGNTKSCKSMANVGFQGLAEGIETPTRHNPSIGVNNELRAAWRTKLEREGKLNTEAKSVRDLVLRSEPER